MSVHVLSWALKNSDTTLADRLVLLVLADHANDDGTGAYPSVLTIAHEARLSKRAAQYALRRLESHRAIAREGVSQYGTTIYRVEMPASAGSDSAPGGAPDAGAHDLHGVQETTQNVQSSAPEPSLEPSTSEADASEDVEQTGNVVSLPVQSRPDPITELFEHWRTQCGHQRARLSPDRRRKIAARLRDFTFDELITAIDGAARGAFVDERGVRHDDLSLIFRNPEKVRLNIARAAATPAARPMTDLEQRTAARARRYQEAGA